MSSHISGSSKEQPARAQRVSGDSPPPTRELFEGADILEALPDACFLLTERGLIGQANSKGSLLVDAAAAQLRELPFRSLLDEADRPRFDDHLSACFREHRGATMETHLRPQRGPAANVEILFSPSLLLRGTFCLLLVRDISARKKQELDLLRFMNLAHHTVNPIEITDATGRIIYVNPAFEQASGYAREELAGKNPNIFGSGKHPKRFWDEMWATITSGKVWVGEVINRRRTGELFYADLLISPIVDGSGIIIGFFGIHRDISAQKQLERKLIEAQKMESIGMLAAGVAHEVGNPLTSISSLVQIIQRTTEDDFTQEKLELIKNQVSRISRIIRDLVDYSRRSNHEIQPTDLNKSLRDAVEIVRVGRKAKDILFDVSFAPDLPPLQLVPDQCEQVFINLLINAVDALITPESEARSARGGAKRVAVESRAEEGWVVVSISDNGRGIPEDDLPKIFEPFFTTKPIGEGTGLGLWVSYGIIKSFQGEITVESDPENGTRFTVRLPHHPLSVRH